MAAASTPATLVGDPRGFSDLTNFVKFPCREVVTTPGAIQGTHCYR